MVIENLFIELSLIVIVALIISIIVSLLRQPLIIGYIITGILISPYFLNLLISEKSIETFAKLGVALLLFMVGLNLNPKVIKDVGKVALITGLGQILFTFIIGFSIGKLLGFATVTSAYIAIAIAFSSTIIIMKLLSDKGETNTLYGRISIGFLIVQDIVAIFILMIISSSSGVGSLFSIAFDTLLKGVGLFIALFFLSVFIIPRITKPIAKSQELLLLFSVGWCLALASLFFYFNFSIEIGALLAGVTLSLSPYRYEISSRMKPLRDFFLLIFFILLGSQMVFTNISNQITPIIIFSLLILIGNPLIIMVLMGFLGYTKRNSFLSGLAVSQISEFSFIIISLGVSIGHISNEILSLTAIIGLITIAGSSYMILYSSKLYPYLSKYLSIFERKGKKVDEGKYHLDQEYKIILFGYNRIGYDLLESLKKIKQKFLIVDYNPEIITQLAEEGIPCRYGDASDSELLNDLNFEKVKMVISTIPDLDTNLLLIDKIKNKNKKAIIITVSHQIDDTLALYKQGATYVITPHFLGGHHTSTLIMGHGLDLDKFLKEKATHLKKLKERKRRGQEHPKHERDSM